MSEFSMSELELFSASPPLLPQCDYSEWPATRVVIPAVYLLAFVAGTLGNGLVLWVYLDRHGKGRRNSNSEQLQGPSTGSPSLTSRSVTESLIASLALADLAFVMTLPLWAAYTALDYHWPFGGALCRASSYLVALNMYASVFSLTALSVERYCVITRSNSNNSMQSRATSRACWVVGSMWVAACILALPALLLRAVRKVHLETGDSDSDWLDEEDGSGNSEGGTLVCLCDMDYSSLVSPDLDPTAREHAELIWSAALGLKSTILGFVLPLIVLLLCYCSLGRLLFHHFNLGPRPDRQRQRRLLRVIVTLVLAFFLCWLPFHVNKTLSALMELDLLPYSCGFDRWLVAAHPYAICLGYVNSCLNPLLYACCDPAFRRRCRGMVRYSWRSSARRGGEETRALPSKSSAMPSGTKEEVEEDEECGRVLEGEGGKEREVNDDKAICKDEYFERL
uniref:Apelin receptor 2 n=1 Tax=Astyanax mexicanus TaxID=7994 RepID=A0A3B1IKH0_ASTMX